MSLLCRIQARLCALPLECVLETMRPLPVETLGGAPTFVSGLAVIRGGPVPVIDAARLLGAQQARPGRWVILVAGGRSIALAVDAVLGVATIPAESLQALTPLLRETSADIVEAIGVQDAELLLLLGSAQLVPEDLWARIDAKGATV